MTKPEIDAEGLAAAHAAVATRLTDPTPDTEIETVRIAITAYLTATRTSEASEPVAPRSEAELEALPAHPLAKWKGGLEMGLHRVHWKGGGTSLASVGQMSDGRKWFAPCNWVSPSQNPEADFWLEIDHTELLHSHPETHHSPVSEEVTALVAKLRALVDDQPDGDAVVLVQRQLFNKVVGALASLRSPKP